MDYRQEMRDLRPVNLRLGNLRDHVVTDIRSVDRDLVLQFDSPGRRGTAFCLVLEQIADSLDRGAVSSSLTAGIVWKPVAEFGRAAATRLALDLNELVEFRLDYENNGVLLCLFQAVAANARIRE